MYMGIFSLNGIKKTGKTNKCQCFPFRNSSDSHMGIISDDCHSITGRSPLSSIMLYHTLVHRHSSVDRTSNIGCSVFNQNLHFWDIENSPGVRGEYNFLHHLTDYHHICESYSSLMTPKMMTLYWQANIPLSQWSFLSKVFQKLPEDAGNQNGRRRVWTNLRKCDDGHLFWFRRQWDLGLFQIRSMSEKCLLPSLYSMKQTDSLISSRNDENLTILDGKFKCL